MTTDDFLTSPDRACADPTANAEHFFATGGPALTVARYYCITCPVQQACLIYALNRGEQFGLWGGVLMTDKAEVQAARDNTGIPEPETLPVAGPIQPPAPPRNYVEAAIAAELRLPHSTVGHIRRRMNLPALYAPRGRRIRQAVTA